MVTRWLVIYYNGDRIKAAMIDDDTSDGSVSMPFGVDPSQVADDCVEINAIIQIEDPATVPFVVIEDEQFDLSPADPAVEVEPVPEGESAADKAERFKRDNESGG